MLKIILVVIAVIAALVFAPLALLWALNTLFALAIPYTIKTWAAALIVGGLFSGIKGAQE